MDKRWCYLASHSGNFWHDRDSCFLGDNPTDASIRLLEEGWWSIRVSRWRAASRPWL
jgi:hypothetical protein